MTASKTIERTINRGLKAVFGQYGSNHPKWWLHIINDNELPGSTLAQRLKGSVAKKGRAYLHVGNEAEISCGWTFGNHRCGWGAGIYIDDGGGDDQLAGHVSLPGVYLSVGEQGLLPRDFARWVGTYKPEGGGTLGKYNARRIEISIHDKKIWVYPWKPDGSWTSDDPWWWAFNLSLDPSDMLGRRVARKEVIREEPVEVPTPERVHNGTAKTSVYTAKRSRWPWWPLAERWLNIEIDLHDDPIPTPGKGTTSYNCGPDALYAFSGAFRTVEEAVGATVASVLRDRRRYGGSHRYSPPQEG